MKKRTLLLVVWTLMLLGVLLSPIRPGLIPPLGGFQHWDKVAHFLLFAVTGFISIYGAGFFSRLWARVLFGLVFGSVLALGTEFGQYFIPFREPDIYDFIVDLAGLFFGLVFYTLFYLWKQRI